MVQNNKTPKIQMSSIPREKCESLEHVREHIDSIDQQLVDLIAARQFYVDQAARFKLTVQAVQSPERVAKVLAKVRAQAVTLGVDPDLIEGMYSTMIQHFIRRELKEIRP
ncbi:isochorismate pyruvate lyase [Acinetobacter calcoaceticus]|uniref:chorismate mutase n=1 Tax=Acinetobacter calcoaceticus TaxID=471 RepID=A0A4R1XLX3_ACICA|nr:isochorismate pyruvate lyase [Acinetobacter calcoaceticus]